MENNGISEESGGSRGSNRVIVLILMICIAAVVCFFSWRYPAKAKPAKTALLDRTQVLETQKLLDVKSIGKVTHELLSRRQDMMPPVSWEDMRTNNIPGILPYAVQVTEWINDALVLSDQIPAAPGLKERYFDRLVITYYTVGNSVATILVTEEDVARVLDPESLKIILYSREYPTPGTSSELPIMYNTTIDYLIIRCEQFSKEWFQAIAIHEIFHAKMDSKGVSAANIEKVSDEFIKEELVAYKIQRELLAMASDGAYIKAILKRVGATNTDPDLETALNSITVEDLEEFDAVWGTASRFESQVRVMQYLFDFSHFWLRDRYGEEGLQKREINVYRSFMELRHGH